jgi:hypothetical protein
MNIALTLSRNNKAILVYDQPLGFSPAWIESSEDGRGVRIIGDGGEEFVAGLLDNKIVSRLHMLSDIILVRMQDRKPVESYKVSFVSQRYGDGR